MTTYKELKTVSHISQNISFAESLINKSFNRYGDNKYATYCPFHNDREDSFRVYVNRHDEVRFHCFGTCKGDWDIYDIIMFQKKCSFREAQQNFASYVGETEFQAYSNQQLNSDPDIPEEKQEEHPTEKIVYELAPEFIEALNDAAEFYNNLLNDNPEQFDKIHNYLKRREIDQDLIKEFGIGFAPSYQDEAFEGRALIKNNLSLFHDDYREFYKYNKSGLVRLLSDKTTLASRYYRRYVDHRESMGIYGEYGDFFAGRITFPVYGINGCIQGLIGRRPDNRGKRWIKQQAQDTFIRPAGWLYGIDKAAASIYQHKTIILVEGVCDYYAFFKLFQNKDMPCVVSTLGTKLTEEGKNILLSAGVENFIVAYDWDDAGRYAIKKAAHEVGGNVYYLGGMTENDDPAVKLKDIVHSINGFSLNHLMSAAKNIQDKTEKPVFISHITTGNIAEREIIFKPNTCLGNDNLSSRTKQAKEYLYDADVILPMLT